GDGVIVTDPDVNLLMINPVAARLFHLPNDLPPNASVPAIIPNEPLIELLRETLENQSHAVREITVPNPENPRREMIYQGLAAAIPAADGSLRGIVTVLRDVTSQKELEQMKSNFLSVVSHELRTPLHSIKGFVDIILMGKTGEVNDLQRDFLGTVKQQTEQLQTMISNLLESSRLEAGQVRLRISDTSMSEVAARVVSKLEPLANDKQVKLSTQITDPLRVEGDQIRLEQVITNLVDNAIKFTPQKGSVTIHGEDLGDQVQISVTDTGIGIAKEDQDKVFERFYQVDSGSTRSYKGTGLGLNICRHIVEHHNGRIWVESQEGQGSTFRFVIPKKLPETEMAIDFTTLPSERTPH
ncbi:MAG: ATP-binding protein, partial [Candidatus Zophobacter franzmannii]|nr:ATP-binding protein [Candidatus Zophobacter franzmannii]